MPQTAELLNADEIVRTIAHIAHQIIEKVALDSPSAGRVVLLDVPSDGVSPTERLADLIEQFFDTRSEAGSLDITLYKDDLRKNPHRALQPMNIPNSEISGTTVVFVDDILFSGRTIRAALDTIADIGHPRVIRLAVLIGRGHRQLPIRADYAGENLSTSRDKDVDVLIEAFDGRGAAILTRAEEQ